ncbi:MAG: cation diffusion facilitator family transporter [Polyangiaceae bacterium]|nr:cation diffusion facilitator family transporter [Polyangiaceae bacterium]
MSADKSTSHIFQSLAVNTAIAVFKGGAAVYTGSGAMLAETIHSFADCGNQLLLLLGVKSSAKEPDRAHPLGYGRSLYFWSFMVALLLFVGGGVFSIYEGIHKLLVPEPVENVWVGVAILAFSLALEGWSTLSNVFELNKRRGKVPFFSYLRATKDSDLIVVFGENSAASLGLFFALAAILLAHFTHDARWDAAGSLVIGIVLVGVAIFLAVEVKSLLLGEAADPKIEAEALKVIEKSERLNELLRFITIQQGPGEVLVACKIRLESSMSADDVCHAINAFERDLRSACPEVRWCFVEPDLEA